MATKIKIRRATAAQAFANNVLLSDGELGIETDTGLMKLGPGNWNSLSYINQLLFKGKFISLAALQTAYPTANYGEYAIVDSGVGANAKEYLWDAEAGWVEGSGTSLPIGVTGDILYNESGLWVPKSTPEMKKILNKDIIIHKSNIAQSHTGTNTLTQLPFYITLDPSVLPIFPNTRFYLEIRSSSTANANAKALGVWLNTVNNSLVGARQIAHHSNPTIGAFACNYSRTFELVNSLTALRYMNIGVGSTGRDDIQNTVAMATTTDKDFGNTLYMLFSVTLQNPADSRTLDSAKLTISNADYLL